MTLRLPRILKTALEETGLPYVVIKGSKHWKLFLDGILVSALPFSGCGDSSQNANLNIRAAIRNKAKLLRENANPRRS